MPNYFNTVAEGSAAPQSLTQGNQGLLTMDLVGNLKTVSAVADMFGSPIYQYRDCQWQINHSLGADSTNITPTATGSGTISYTTNPGGVTLATTAVASSGYNLLSTLTLSYQVAFEWYCYFTVGFPSVTGSVGSQVGLANNHQRIGFYNNSGGNPLDGFFVGFEGASSFGVTHFLNGTGQDSFSANSAVGIAISSFNGDKCGGTAGSSFTSSGSPVAINFAKMNLFRLRGGWLGIGVVVLEVCSPDGTWVVMHTYHNPNSLTAPYASTTTWNHQIDLQNNASGTSNVSMVMGGGVFGSSSAETRITDTLNGQAVVPTVRSAEWAQYSTSAPSLSTNGQYNPLQLDASGNLKVNVAGPLQTGNAPTFATVGVTSATALAANTSRSAVVLTNTSGNTIYLAFGANAAVVGSGIVLYPYGGSLQLNVEDNVQQAIQAIASAASSNLAIQEFN